MVERWRIDRWKGSWERNGYHATEPAEHSFHLYIAPTRIITPAPDSNRIQPWSNFNLTLILLLLQIQLIFLIQPGSKPDPTATLGSTMIWIRFNRNLNTAPAPVLINHWSNRNPTLGKLIHLIHYWSLSCSILIQPCSSPVPAILLLLLPCSNPDPDLAPWSNPDPNSELLHPNSAP